MINLIVDYSSESNSVGSDSLLQGSRWWGCATTPNPVLRPGLLRPSMLSTSKLNSLSSASAQSPKTDSEEVATPVTTNPLNSKPFVTFNTADSTTRLTSASNAKSNIDEHFKVLSKSNDGIVPENNSNASSKNSDNSRVEKDSLKGAVGAEDGDDNGDKNKARELSTINKDVPSFLDKERCSLADGPVKKKAAGEDDFGQNTNERPDPMQLLRMNGLERTNLFSVSKNPIPYVAKSDYVFGQNVHERVVSNKTNQYDLELYLFLFII